MFSLIGGLLIWVIFTLFPLPILLFFGLFKLIHTIYYAKIKKSIPAVSGEGRDKLFSLSPLDPAFAPDSSWVKPGVNLGLVLKLEGEIPSIENLRRHFYRCFLDKSIEGGRYDKLSSYLIAQRGFVYRAQVENVELGKLIVEVTLNKSVSIEDFLGKWMTTVYKEKMPCWEMILVKGPETFLAFKIHHSMCDGYSLLYILDRLCGNTSPYLVKDFQEGWWRQVRQLIEAPIHLLPLRKRHTAAVQTERNGPFFVSCQPGEGERMVSFTRFPLDVLKEIRRRWDVHMSSVLIVILTGALRQFLERDIKNVDVPKNMTFCQSLRWPRHPSRNSSLPNRDRLCNHALLTSSPNIPLAERDPLSRLRLIENELKNFLDRGLDKFCWRVVAPLAGMISFTSVVGNEDRWSRLLPAGGFTCIVGGDNYRLLGSRVKNINPFVSINDYNFPMTCFTFSHSGILEMTFCAHSSVFKDRKTLNRVLNEYAHEELKELLRISRNSVVITNTENAEDLLIRVKQ